MSRNSIKISDTIQIIHGSDQILGQFIDICDSRYTKSGQDHQGEGYVMEWSSAFGFSTNLIKAVVGDLHGCLDDPKKIIELSNTFIKALQPDIKEGETLEVFFNGQWNRVSESQYLEFINNGYTGRIMGTMGNKITQGPWQVIKDELGTRIFTKWDHPQSKGPEPIITTFTEAKDGKLIHGIAIKDADAEAIAMLPDLQKELKEAREAAIQASNIATDRLNEQYSQLKERGELLELMAIALETERDHLIKFGCIPSVVGASALSNYQKLKTKTDKDKGE